MSTTSNTPDVLSSINDLLGDAPAITWAKDGQTYTATIAGREVIVKRSGKYYGVYVTGTDFDVPVRTVAEGKLKALELVPEYVASLAQAEEDITDDDGNVIGDDLGTVNDDATDDDEMSDDAVEFVPGTFDDAGNFTPDESADVPAQDVPAQESAEVRAMREQMEAMQAQMEAMQAMLTQAQTQAVPAAFDNRPAPQARTFEPTPAELAAELTEQALRTGRHPNAGEHAETGYGADEITRMGAEIAGEIWQLFMTYMKFPDHMAAAYAGTLTLWVLSTHLYYYQGVTPYILVSSPTAGAGKSTLIGIASKLIRNPAIEVNPTPAVIRSLAGDGFSLMIDECDELYASKDFKSILNAGYKKGGMVSRVKGKSVVRDNVFGPKLFAGIGREGAPLQGALLDRCIQIWLERAMPGERPIFDPDMISDDLRLRIVAWSRGVVSHLHRDPQGMPAFPTPRSAELWRPLISIADQLGGTWGQDARVWAIDLESKKEGQADQNVQILSDVRDVIVDWLTAHPTETMIATEELLELRNSANGRQYADKLTGVSLGKRLKQFGITSTPRKGVRFYIVGNGQGGLTADLDRVFARYLDSTPQV